MYPLPKDRHLFIDHKQTVEFCYDFSDAWVIIPDPCINWSLKSGSSWVYQIKQHVLLGQVFAIIAQQKKNLCHRDNRSISSLLSEWPPANCQNCKHKTGNLPNESGRLRSRLPLRWRSAKEVQPSISPGKASKSLFEASKNISCFNAPIICTPKQEGNNQHQDTRWLL